MYKTCCDSWIGQPRARHFETLCGVNFDSLHYAALVVSHVIVHTLYWWVSEWHAAYLAQYFHYFQQYFKRLHQKKAYWPPKEVNV